MSNFRSVGVGWGLGFCFGGVVGGVGVCVVVLGGVLVVCCGVGVWGGGVVFLCWVVVGGGGWGGGWVGCCVCGLGWGCFGFGGGGVWGGFVAAADQESPREEKGTPLKR